MGRVVDYAFKMYANRWKFKHPTRKIFSELWKTRLVLDWFWLRFYSTDFVDIGIKMSNNITFLKRQLLALKDVKVRKDASELIKDHLYI
jgi:hypothetical protein